MKLGERLTCIALLSVCLEQRCLEDDLLQFIVFIYYRKVMEIKVKVNFTVACYLILYGYQNT